jgi:hypothetical protein
VLVERNPLGRPAGFATLDDNAAAHPHGGLIKIESDIIGVGLELVVESSN